MTRWRRFAVLRLPWLAALAALALYLPSLGNGFIRDNDAHLATPGWIDGIGLAQAFTDNSWHVVYEGRYYRPLVFATHKLDSALFGTAPAGHHLTNVVLYAALCAVVCSLLAEVGGPPLARALLALAFVVHPAHAECVAWISGRSDLLAALAGCAALLAAARGRALGAGAWLAAALFAKEVGAAFALVLLAAAALRRDRRLAGATILAVGLYTGFRLTALSPQPGAAALMPDTPAEAALMMAVDVKLVGRYAAMLLTGQTWGAFAWDELVARHHLLGPARMADHLTLELDAELGAALLALCGLAALCAWMRAPRRAAVDAFLLLGATALAASFTALRLDAKVNFADRYLLVPSLAAAVALAARLAAQAPRAAHGADTAGGAGAASGAEPAGGAGTASGAEPAGVAGSAGRRRVVRAVALCALVAGLGAWAAESAARARRYSDPETFAAGAVADDPLSGIAWQMLAARRAEAGDAVGAWDARLRALALHGELVERFDVRSGDAWAAYATAVLVAARWRTPASLETLARARARWDARELRRALAPAR